MNHNVGKAYSRNKEYFKKFDKSKIIKQKINKENPVCVDVGAYQGQSVELLRNIFNNPLIYSFEPIQGNYEVLKSKNYNNNLCFNMAISNFTGTTIFYQNEISHTSSLFKVNIESKDSVTISKANENNSKNKFSDYNKKINVNTTTLDDFYESQKLSDIDLLKIDVQGAEALVVEGGVKTFLKHTHSLVVEVSFYDYYEQSNTLYSIEKHIIPLGFKLFSILDISQNPMNGRTDWIEVFYTKD